MDTNSSFSACLPCQMGDIISFAGRGVPYAFGLIEQELGYLIFYEGHFKELADRVRDLEASREEINHWVEAERRCGKKVEVGVQNWLGEANKVIGRANQLLQDPRRGEVGCYGFLFPNMILRYRLSKIASETAKDVVEVRGRKDFNRVGYLPALDEMASSSTTREGEKLETRELFKEYIVKALKDPNSRNIGVYGLGGVGKTYLVEEVIEIAKKDKLFDAVVIARVSKTPDIKTIQGEIADLLGLRFEEETIVGRAHRLRQRIEAEKTILVILDDIWTRLELEKVGIPSRNEHNGCKLLMTSRNEDVLLQMDARKDFIFRLELLNEAETWSLFQSMVGDVVKDDIRLQNLATQVAQKCGALPLGIATVARALRNKDIYAWKDALRQLENVGNAEIDAKIHSVLELSYNWLESDEMRALFLLFAVLLGDGAEYYLKVAMGLGTFKHINTVDDARNRFQKIIGSLKASCLLLEGNSSGQIQMHDRVSEVAISIASRDKHVFMVKPKNELKEWPTNDFLRRCSQIVLDYCHIHKLPQRLDCPNVKLFILVSANRSLEIPDTIFEGMGNLSVLDLSNLNLSSLPTSFRFLTGLQTLCLEQCVLENMNAIEALKNLEFLSFQRSSMNKLPSEIGKLTQLRMLDLSHSGIEVIPPNIISSLTKLEELNMGDTSIKWEDETSANQNENASLVELQQLSNLTALELQIREAWILPRDLQLMFEKLERYKIAIGDVWDWSDIKDRTLKTLMLKLRTNIHLEHGIKALIKGVENLYLDEVEGIQNVLYQLNWEGFPWMKHLHIQNNAKMKHIVDSAERNQDRDSFPKLETLVLLNLRNLEQICHGPLAVNSFGKLNVIKVKKCVQLKYLLSFSMVKGLSQLSEIEVCQCNSMKKIVLGDINSSADNNIPNEKIEFLYLRSLTLEHLQTLDNFFSYELTSSMNERVDTSVSAPLISAQIAFPNLDTLKLSSLNLNKIWGDNQHSLDKLTNLIVENCDGLKYLFSSTVVGSFMNLKHLEVSNCPMMEEIIAREERNDGISALEEVGFFKLEKIILKDMGNLKTIWHRQFKKLKTLQVNNCEKVVVVFPSSMQKAYNNLEMLEVTHCALVEEIFELTSNENSSVESTTRLKGITLHGLPKLKKIWNRDPQGILNFRNLENVYLTNCGSLEYLFPLSVATCCSHLKELSIKYSGNMKEIVAEKKESVCTAPIFEFNQLNTLLLWRLYKLKGFYAGNHTLKCPSLRTINVVECAKLNLYTTVSTSSPETCRDGKLPVLTQQVFIVEEVIPNLEKLRINQRDANVILQAQNLGALFTKLTFLGLSGYKTEEAAFPYWFLQNVHTLEYLFVEWSSFKKIFQDERQVSKKIHRRLKNLTLNKLPRLQRICEEGSRIDPVLEFLEQLHVSDCHGLTNLLPSSVTFNHLTYLRITNCNGLINLITSSTARSLDKLTTMEVKDCNSLEEIITGEENAGIAFTSLQILMLECLPNLNKFCSSKCFLKFPLLERVVVSKCPRMKIFSKGNTRTPILRKVKISENDEEWHWKGNLNDTIKNMCEDKVAFCSFNSLKLSEYPELKELWYGQLQRNVFRSLKCLVVHKCDFLSDVLFQPNLFEVLMKLEELHIRHCNSLEAVFDLKDKFGEENLVKNSTQLKKLTLCSLPKLKHVWKEDPHNTLRFQNLCEVSVGKCKSLTSLFPISIARDITQLQNLQVYHCGIEEIVGKEEGTEEIIRFEFPHLISLDLRNLPKLKAFFDGVHSLQCKSLKSIDVFACPKLKLFKTEPTRHQESARNDRLNVSMYRPLFKIEEVLANVDTLTLNDYDFDMILQSQYSGVQFINVKFIRVSVFRNEEAIFPYWFLKNFPNLETLMVEWCSFTEIFQGERPIGEEKETQINTRLTNLDLIQLHGLQHICKEGFQMDPILQLLERICVKQCCNLIKLVPSSVTFTCLTYLEVTNCNGLINLITCSTAKSLVKLSTMKIKMCNLLEDVVNGKEHTGISFHSLQYLELISLPRLRRFCSCVCPIEFPLLEEVIVKECPRMENFSLGETRTPNLQYVQIKENDQECRWEGDLNQTIKIMFDDKVAFCQFEHLTMSDYPELKDLWYGQLHDNVFCNLKSLVVERCDFLSDILFPSNVLQVLHGLEDLVVRDCDSLETVFDVEGMLSKEIFIKQSTQLKRLTLSSLPKLKHIWNEDPYEIISFGNLCTVNVSMCQNLLYVFPWSLCEDLGHLEVLEIESCGVEEIVAMEEGSFECTFNFPQLTKLVLHRLTNLKNFYPGRHTLECPSLKVLNVYRCEALRMFSFTDLDFQQPDPVDEIHDMLFRQALFSIKKLSPNLERLAINGTDALRILNVYRQENTFHKIELLHLQCFDETPTIFLNDFHAIFPNLVTLEVRSSSFGTLFPIKGTIDHLSMQIPKQVRNLWLFEMERLKYIWQEEGFPLDHPLLQDLEVLGVINCPSLISLVPSSTTFTNLTSLKVDNCKELIYLMTSSTAKSLVQLTTLEIENCEKILDVVKIDEERGEEDIIFENLEYLKFISLSCCRSFCYGKHIFMFPSLLRFVVKGCPQMKIFSSGVTVAPFLIAIEVENEKMRWKDDLNTTIEQLFIEQELSHSSDK